MISSSFNGVPSALTPDTGLPRPSYSIIAVLPLESVPVDHLLPKPRSFAYSPASCGLTKPARIIFKNEGVLLANSLPN